MLTHWRLGFNRLFAIRQHNHRAGTVYGSVKLHAFKRVAKDSSSKVGIVIELIIIIIIPGQCLWCCHHAVAALREFTLVYAVSAARRQVAADLWTKPIGLNHKPA